MTTTSWNNKQVAKASARSALGLALALFILSCDKPAPTPAEPGGGGQLRALQGLHPRVSSAVRASVIERSSINKAALVGSTDLLSNYDVVVHLDGSYPAYVQPLSEATQQALQAFVSGGKGYVTGQWTGYEQRTNIQTSMPNLVLMGWAESAFTANCGNCQITYTVEADQASHPVLAGLPSAFTFTADGHDAGDAYLFPEGENQSVRLATATNAGIGGNAGILVRNYGEGRVVNFSVAPNYVSELGQNTLQDPNIQKLYVNSAKWASGLSTPRVLLLVDAAGAGTTALQNALIAAGMSVDSCEPEASCVATPVVGPPSAPTITEIMPSDLQLSVAFTPPSNDGGAPITNYEYATNNGESWTAVSPAQTSSPIVIAGLTNGTEYQVAIRAVNSAGPGAQSNTVAATPANQTQEEIPPNNEPAEVTVTEDGKEVAGVAIQANTFNEAVIVTVRLKTVEEGGVCHNYLVGQYGRCLEIDAQQKDGGGDAVLLKPLVAGLCMEMRTFPLEIYKFEDANAAPRPLREAPSDFLDCSGFTVDNSKPSNWMEALAMGVTKRVGKWITPKSAYAADMGFGGYMDDGHTSFLTWASPIQLGISGLARNVFPGKDAFGVTGKFASLANAAVPANGFLDQKGFAPELTENGFNPLTQAITVQYGDFIIQTLSPGQLKYVKLTKRYTYISGASEGINYLDIDHVTGAFTIGGRTRTYGTYSDLGLERPFTIRIGSRIRGGRLFCKTNGLCALHHH